MTKEQLEEVIESVQESLNKVEELDKTEPAYDYLTNAIICLRNSLYELKEVHSYLYEGFGRE